MTVFRLRTHSAAQTRALGAVLAGDLASGDLAVFRGDLGAGKSEICRGILRAKGVEGPIQSPTFTLLNLYEVNGETLCHFDWYRLSGADEIAEAGFYEMLPGDTLALVEWPERAEEALPGCRLEADMRCGEGETDRVITLRPVGGFHDLPGVRGALNAFEGVCE